MLQRRGFLGAMLAAAVAPAFIKHAMPVKAISPAGILGVDYGAGDDETVIFQQQPGRLFRGELGRVNDGVRFVSKTDPHAARAFSQVLQAEAKRRPKVAFMEDGSWIIVPDSGWVHELEGKPWRS